MISGIFIDRPRLAFVVSIVITLAGLIAIFADPGGAVPRHRAAAGLAHRHLSRRRRRGGRDARWRSPSSSRSYGVDNALYYQSASGADGSYTLTVTFALGTDPDINTVNVQNRAQLATPLLPQEVQRQGLVIRKKSAALLQVDHASTRPRTPTTRSISTTTPPSTSSTRWRSIRGVGQATLFGAARLFAAALARPRPADRLQPHADRRGRRPSRARTYRRRSAALARRRRRRPSRYQLTIKTQGRLTRPDQFDNIVVRANPDGSVVRVKDVARADLGAKTPGALQPLQRRAVGGDRHLPVARRQRRRRRGARPQGHGRAQAALSRRSGLPACSGIPRCSSPRPIDEVIHTLVDRLRAGGDRRLPVPRQAAHHAHPAGRRAGVHHRHLRGHAG